MPKNAQSPDGPASAPAAKPDPLSAILAEMRYLSENRDWHNHTKQSNRECVSNLADRIEAAAKRKLEMSKGLSKNLDKNHVIPGNAATKWLYRLEYHDGTCGLWYDGSGNWCFERGIGSLDDSCKTKSLPMDYDERYRQDGRSWFSSCSRKEDLLHWYSREDAKRLLSHGFVFTRYLATEYREYDQQTVFIKETCLYREEIDFESLWKSTAPGSLAAPARNVDRPECRTRDEAWKVFERESAGMWAADWDAAFSAWLFDTKEEGAK